MHEVRNKISSIPVIEGDDPKLPFMGQDNLAIALATYFDNHPSRPDKDDIDDELGWGVWVIERVNDLLDRVVAITRPDQKPKP